jgi:hypothetical protein
MRTNFDVSKIALLSTIELALAVVRLNHVASFIVNANHSLM